ncbi:hypothetical protein FHX42_000694 [Saccharopolyspora lacisalsi]|uniref:Uncharacterized protein n=1 Tax=Halosaccharopolyspora lacisalsi TaxID=1000566 RepID=A0A839DVP5_9PSEU|nr:hypothetical protein [Halosaccharopolyspora lacisalsi]MBA8823365.1 hypothetical protein [Halosaccharopolyspora lacisalsi]
MNPRARYRPPPLIDPQAKRSRRAMPTEGAAGHGGNQCPPATPMATAATNIIAPTPR